MGDDARISCLVLEISSVLLENIHKAGEEAYPEEGTGLLLGKILPGRRVVKEIQTLKNARESAARQNRYAIDPLDYAYAEEEAEKRGLSVVGIFHSHPDHPNRPSEFDQEWALPWFTYLITSVEKGTASGSRAWRLTENGDGFLEEALEIAS
jgi:proteasome lid subunit RPN8/RPN11